MALTKVQRLLKRINDVAKYKSKERAEAFRKALIQERIDNPEKFNLSEEDVLELKQAIQTTSRGEQQQSSLKVMNNKGKRYFDPSIPLDLEDERLDWDRINRLIQESTDKEAAEAKK